ncbi:MAG: hypothetical protein AAGI52_09340 [Bacteroidota bacterium]
MRESWTDQERIVSLGFDGDGLEVSEREAWALDAADAEAILGSAQTEGLGACLVSTCFRVELLVSGHRPPEELLTWGRRHLSALRPEASTRVFEPRVGVVALRHLVRVAAGLESAVLGEAQILGQVRRARAEADRAGALTPALRLTLQTALRTGQRVRRQTELGRGAASTASAAIRLAQETGAGVKDRHVFVIGAGQIGRLMMGLLPGAEPRAITLVSAHAPQHAGFRVVRPDEFPDVLAQADVVFAATDRLVLPLDAARTAWGDGRQRTVVDLGVPRNIPATVGRLYGVTLHDIDALGAVVDAGLQTREAAVPAAERIVENTLEVLREELDGLVREELVADFRRRAEDVRQETLAYVCGKCSERTCGASESGEGPGPGLCSDPATMSKVLTKRLLHDVTVALRSGAGDTETLRRLLALGGDD